MILRPIDSDQPGTRPVKKGTRSVTGGSVAWEKGDDVAGNCDFTLDSAVVNYRDKLLDVCGWDKLFYRPQSDRINLLVNFVLSKRRAYRREAQNRWMRVQASSSKSVAVA